jgi:Ala-tRNA(Pro) deacylase
MSTSVFERLSQWLGELGVSFTVTRHAPVFTSEEAAQVRGTPLASGAKALIVKANDKFVMLVLPADRKLDSKKARLALAAKSIRFATKDEVETITTLQPGAIPPFGSLFELSTYVDPMLGDNPSINFNAGDHAISIQMTFADYAKVESPAFAQLT